MYQYSYSEIMIESPVDARVHERLALDHAINLLREAEATDSRSQAEQQALTFTTQLWGVFIKDLSEPGNDLPDDVRARLISVGLWVLNESQRIALGESRDLAGIAEICGLLRDGLN